MRNNTAEKGTSERGKMTREELLNSCEGIIHTQAKKFCRRYKLNDAISDLEQEGRLAVLKLIKKNTYDPKKSPFHIYAQPFIHGAMRRYIEKNIGNLSLSKQEMDTILDAKLMHFDGYSDDEICKKLNITSEELGKHLGYDLKSYYINDLTETEEDDPYDLEIMVDKTACNPHKFVHRRYCIKYFKEIFDLLSDKDKSLLGHYYGAFGYEEMTIKDIATLEMMTESGVKKAKEKAIEHFWELFPRSNFSVWIDAFHRVRLQIKYTDRDY